ncbi:NADPH oxidase 5 [Onychostruthus taczanowskii]|uniref:NADPH oxidase 5 n=1 Tax=Onychostruthus taczanowskii TaxID=356909 RepID=UPI001B806F5E|nr:NADPH oxidase 5 [Onychostruthus taczanowskii]
MEVTPGSIDAEELRVVLRGCLRESSLALPEERLGALSQALLQALDRDHSGSITFPELREQLEAFPELLENLSISAASWLKPPSASPSEPWLCCCSRESLGDRRAGMCCCSRESHGDRRAGMCCCSRESLGDRRAGMCCFSRESHGDQRARRCCLGAWLATTALLLALGALWHRERGPALALARGCGQSLNLNCALLAALMLRRSLTWLRSTPLAELFPLELHVRGHERVGHLVLALGTAHAGAHLAQAGLAQRDWLVALGEYARRARPGAGGLGGTAPQTGLALLALLLAMLACSSPCVRRGGHFEVFYWSHLSYIPVWILLLLHGPHFWKWFLIPGSLFVLEKVLGWAWRRAGDLHILEAKLLPSKVTHLVIQRPKSFRFQPGDYVYLNIPAIAAYEWHPFSISSAPEQPETLWLHIRARGQWTTKLYEYFQQLELHGPEPNLPRKSWMERRSRHWEQEGSVAFSRDGAVELTAFQASGATFPGKDPEQGGAGPRETQRSCSVKCFLDGPYGTPSRRIFTSEHAVLIGAGIGITPFASILQSIMFRYRRRKQSCPSCHFSWSEERRDEEMTLRKVGTGARGDVGSRLGLGWGCRVWRWRAQEHPSNLGALGMGAGSGIRVWCRDPVRSQGEAFPPCQVDFIWITRDQQHLQWFLGLLAKLEAEQEELEPGGEQEHPGHSRENPQPGPGPGAGPDPGGRLESLGLPGKFLELQLYMTSALGKGDVKALGLQLALDLLAAREQRDSISGLRSRTRPGRPDWDQVFAKVAAERRGKVRVFFCGSAGLAKLIRGHCRSFGFRFSKENF